MKDNFSPLAIKGQRRRIRDVTTSLTLQTDVVSSAVFNPSFFFAWPLFMNLGTDDAKSTHVVQHTVAVAAVPVVALVLLLLFRICRVLLMLISPSFKPSTLRSS